jgi:hypothetical protein
MSRTAAALQIDIVRLEDKENKLKAFIRALLCPQPHVGIAGSSIEHLLLVARSASSPVAKAIASLAREGVLCLPVRAVFLLDKPDGSDESLCRAADLHLPLPLSVRIARDQRLSDAHEQLVLGPASSWFGDCMRRDPMKRDAYECFAASCTETAAWARISFERIWATSKPVAMSPAHPASMPADGTSTAAAADTALIESADPASDEASHSRQG